jgi:hypothetical protein
MGAHNRQQHICRMFHGEEPQLMIFHCRRHILERHSYEWARAKIQNQPQKKFQVHERDEQEAESTKSRPGRFSAAPARGRDDNRCDGGSQDKPAQHSVKCEKMRIKSLQHFGHHLSFRRFKSRQSLHGVAGLYVG